MQLQQRIRDPRKPIKDLHRIFRPFLIRRQVLLWGDFNTISGLVGLACLQSAKAAHEAEGRREVPSQRDSAETGSSTLLSVHVSYFETYMYAPYLRAFLAGIIHDIFANG